MRYTGPLGPFAISSGAGSMPKSSSLAANIDAYGKYARASALADYLELLAFLGRPAGIITLNDYVKDNDWTRRDFELFDLPSDPDAPTEDDAREEDLASEF